MKKTFLAYSDLNWFQKILYKIRLKKYLKSKIDYKRLVGSTMFNEAFKRENKSYNEIINEEF